MSFLISGLAGAGAPAASGAPALVVHHEPVGCVIGERFPQLDACFEPAAARRARVYFRADAARVFHFVEMSPVLPSRYGGAGDTGAQGTCYRGTLPRPASGTRTLHYYVAAMQGDGPEARSEIYTAQVVPDERSCPRGPVAPLLSAARVVVEGGGRPAGFLVEGGGVGGKTIAAIVVGAGGAAAGGLLLARGGSATGASGTTTPETQPPTTTPPATTTSTQPRPPSTTTTTRPRPPTTTTTTRPSTTTTTAPPATTTTTTRPPVTTTTTAPPATTTTTQPPATTTTTAPPATTTTTTAPPATTTTSTAPPAVALVSRKTSAASTTTITTATPARLQTSPGQLVWTSELRAPNSRGQVIANGTEALFPKAGREDLSLLAVAGVNRVEAVLVDGPMTSTTWAFTLSKGALRPGSLRVLAGDVAALGPEAVVFRLRGRPGERVVFVYEPAGPAEGRPPGPPGRWR